MGVGTLSQWVCQQLDAHRSAHGQRYRTLEIRMTSQMMSGMSSCATSASSALQRALVGNNIVLAIFKHMTNPEARQYLLRQAFEEAIHTHTFHYIVRIARPR